MYLPPPALSVFQRGCAEYRFLNPHCVPFSKPPPSKRVSACVSHVVFPRGDGLHPVHNGRRSKAMDIYIIMYCATCGRQRQTVVLLVFGNCIKENLQKQYCVVDRAGWISRCNVEIRLKCRTDF